jgi:hypothetical protein
VTVEEVAMLASRFGWSYETLMAMSGAERRLWLAAADRVAADRAATDRAGASTGTVAVAAQPVPPAATPAVTEAERRARLLELAQQYAARYRR